MSHPLTDDICLAIDDNPSIAYMCFDWKKSMRAAADWQLEQVMKWLNETIFERGSCLEAVNIPEELAEAMRPTQEKI
jgi:hypothetical protein